MISTRIFDRILDWISRLLSVDVGTMDRSWAADLDDSELSEQLHFGRG